MVFSSAGFLSCYSMVIGNVKSQGQVLNKKGNTVLRYPASKKDQKMDLQPKGEGFLEITGWPAEV